MLARETNKKDCGNRPSNEFFTEFCLIWHMLHQQHCSYYTNFIISVSFLVIELYDERATISIGPVKPALIGDLHI